MFGTGLGAAVGDFVTKLVFSTIALWLSQNVGMTIWPTQWPLFFQIVLVYLIAELGRYWQHRLMHLHPKLWQYHRLHHSIDRMGVLKTSRSHIMERIFQQVFMFSCLLVIGTPTDVMLYYIIPNSFLGMIDHSNIDLKLGYLEYIIMGPGGHRLHHSQDMIHGNSNFGSALMFWDMIFGTFINPLKTTPPDRVGIKNDPMPIGFVDQIVDGFKTDSNLALQKVKS
ncbi:MAG: sterol desaturase family protein [Bdellovibrionales bacterium]|nr:sterol desaturase family protein [Bdellovibrionales bacterium]